MDLDFYTVSIRSGYYGGAQLYVERKNEDYDSSKTERALARETKELQKKLEDFAKKHGMYKIRVKARFSNGETMYEKVD